MRSLLSNSYFLPDSDSVDVWIEPIIKDERSVVWNADGFPRCAYAREFLIEDRAMMELTGALPSEVWA